jgi:hypothetical protein
MGLEVLAIPTGVSLISFGAAALVVHAMAIMMTHASAFSRYTAKQTVVSLVVVLSNAVAAGGRVVTRTVGMLVQWWLFLGVLFAVFSCLYVTYNEYPSVWTGSVRVYNRNLGPWLHQTVLVPLKVVDLLLQGLLPLWDSVVWFLKAVWIQGLLPLVVDEAETVLRMATTLVDLTRNLSTALFDFVESFFCEGAKCLQPERGVMDVLSSMGNVREFASLGTQLVKNFCGTLSAPIDMAIYPLLDLNLAESVHNLVNAILQLFVVVPWKTTLRCGLSVEANQFSLLMCTPDMAPVFHFLAAGMSSLGLALDNWGNIAFVIVQELLTGDAPSCDSGPGGAFPQLLGSGLAFATPGAPTAIVGLTDWLYAVTDGTLAYYLAHTDGTQTKTQAWPYPVDPSLGIAAVTYSSVHDLDVSAFSSGKTAGALQTTGMLGCICVDGADGGPMRVSCSILPMSGIPPNAPKDDYRLEVLFPTTDAALLYTCAGVDLYVKSVRWSYTRYETADASLGSGQDRTTLPTTDCIARGTCRELDAVVWLVPRCGQDFSANRGELACVSSAPCMPFCMAARTAGGGRDNLVLTGARRWREGTTVLGQDCALESGSVGTVQAGAPSAFMSVSSVAGSASGLLQAGGVGVYGYADTRSTSPICKRSPRVTSVLTKPESVRSRVAANVRLFDQPFAITGDTILSTVRLGGEANAVQVERLEGSEADVFSLNSLNQQLPALPKASVPLEDAARDRADMLNIPYNYGTTRIASTNSRNYVFYASNPNSDALGAYFQYCADQANPQKLSKFGLLFKSSYSRLRVYRVSAYRRCGAYSCGADLVRFVELQGFSMNFNRGCGEVFNASVQALEYLNEDNVAVTVQAAFVRDYDEGRGTFQGGNRTTSRTFWLNPATMRVKDTIWQTAVPASALGAVLCPAMQRLPRVGSFLAELINSGVFLLKFTVNSIVYTPGLVKMWRVGQLCPLPGSAQYHSVLVGCGGQAFALDDFFDSVDDAGALFWHSLALLAALISPSKPAVAEPLTRVMTGMSQYGQGTIDLWAARTSVLTLTRVPIQDQLTTLWASVESGVQQGGARQGLSAGGAGIVAWSRYSYRALSTIAVEITKRVLDPAFDLDAGKVFALIWASLYDLRDEFDATVTSRLRLGCGGLKLMFGLDNPWANLVYYQCAAGAELTRDLLGLALNIFVQVRFFYRGVGFFPGLTRGSSAGAHGQVRVQGRRWPRHRPARPGQLRPAPPHLAAAHPVHDGARDHQRGAVAGEPGVPERAGVCEEGHWRLPGHLVRPPVQGPGRAGQLRGVRDGHVRLEGGAMPGLPERPAHRGARAAARGLLPAMRGDVTVQAGVLERVARVPGLAGCRGLDGRQDDLHRRQHGEPVLPRGGERGARARQCDSLGGAARQPRQVSGASAGGARLLAGRGGGRDGGGARDVLVRPAERRIARVPQREPGAGAGGRARHAPRPAVRGRLRGMAGRAHAGDRGRADGVRGVQSRDIRPAGVAHRHGPRPRAHAGGEPVGDRGGDRGGPGDAAHDELPGRRHRPPECEIRGRGDALLRLPVPARGQRDVESQVDRDWRGPHAVRGRAVLVHAAGPEAGRGERRQAGVPIPAQGGRHAAVQAKVLPPDPGPDRVGRAPGDDARATVAAERDGACGQQPGRGVHVRHQHGRLGLAEAGADSGRLRGGRVRLGGCQGGGPDPGEL